MFNFLKKSTFGLDISDRSIRTLQLKKGEILGFGKKALNQGIVEDGSILNKEKLIEKIKQVIYKANIKSKKVVLSLPESKVFIHAFPVALSAFHLKELKREKENIKKQADQMIPWKPDEIYFDIFDNLYAAAPKGIVNDYLEVLKGANLEPIVFEIESLALARAIKAKNCLVADIGVRTTNLSIFDKKGQIKISVSIARAGDQFTKAISKKLNVSLSQAEKLKIDCGLDKTKKQGRIMLVLQKELQPIIKETKKIINLYGKSIDEILLNGGSSQMPEIADYFSSNLSLETNIAISPIAKQLKGKSVFFNTVIGLALRKPKIGINLLSNIK